MAVAQSGMKIEFKVGTFWHEVPRLAGRHEYDLTIDKLITIFTNETNMPLEIILKEAAQKMNENLV